jgi:DNA-binding MltR family transcriptional regulator
MVLKGKKSEIESLTKSKDFQGFYDELQSESDRSAAIIGAAFIDEHLKQLLTNHLVDDEKEAALFLSSESPLGSFGARIRAAYCMGLVSKEYFEALKIIKDIRNAFAHQLHGRSFNDNDIEEACKRLQAFMPLKPRVTHSPRQMFESSTIFILMDISLKALTTLQKRCKTPPAPSISQELSV